jgi:hypothetical protein
MSSKKKNKDKEK